MYTICFFIAQDFFIDVQIQLSPLSHRHFILYVIDFFF